MSIKLKREVKASINEKDILNNEYEISKKIMDAINDGNIALSLPFETIKNAYNESEQSEYESLNSFIEFGCIKLAIKVLDDHLDAWNTVCDYIY